MALRELLLPWDAQPQEVGVVADGNPLAAGLVAYIPAHFDALGSNTVTPDAGLTVSATARGLLWDSFNTSRKVLTSVPQLRGAFSVIFDFYYGASTAGGQTLIAQGGSGSGGGGWQLRLTTGNPSPFALTFGGIADYSNSSALIAVGQLVTIGLTVSGNGGSARYFINGAFDSSRTVGTQNTASTPLVLGAVHNGTAYLTPLIAGNQIGNVLLWRRALSDAEVAEVSAAPWRVVSRRIFVPVSAGGGAFSATGAISADAATLSGAATHLTLHASTGVLTSDAATVSGSANHITVHPSSGALTAQDATLAGAALRYRQFTSSGALTSDSATVAGTAAVTTTGTFSAAGDIAADAATLSGTATHLTLHTATGAIQAGDSTITGTAARLGTHDATGSLSADLASITGTALHTGDGAEVVTLRTGGHAYLRNRFTEAKKRLALQRILSYLTEEEPAEETKRIIRAVKAGKPVEDKKPPVVMAEVSAEKIADKLIPSRVADLAEIPDIDMQAVIKKAIRLAQERDDEDVLLLL